MNTSGTGTGRVHRRLAAGGLAALALLAGGLAAWAAFGPGGDDPRRQAVTVGSVPVTTPSPGSGEAPARSAAAVPATPAPPASPAPSRTPASAAPDAAARRSAAPPAALPVSWLDGGGQARLSGLVIHSAMASAGGDVRVACLAVRRDVAAARAYRPVPDPAAQRVWARGLGMADRGARRCLDGVARRDARLVHTAARDLALAGRYLTGVAAALAKPGARR